MRRLFSGIAVVTAFIVLPLLCWFLQPAMSAPLRTFYVATSGDDTANGSAATPWKTLQRAARDVLPGDFIIVRPGRYTGFVLGWDGPQNGTAENPITFQGEPGAIFESRNTRTADGINLEGASYIVIEGFTISNGGTITRAGIRSVTNQHVVIRNNQIDQAGQWGILTGFSDDVTIENNVTSRSQIEHGIYVSNSCVNAIVRNNQVWGNAGNGIHMNGDLSQGGNGLILNALVEKNVIYDNGRQGGSGINGDGVQNSKILNNVLYNNHPFRGSIDISADSLANFTSNFNVIMERFTTDGEIVLNLAQWKQNTGQNQNSVVASPFALFVNAASNDYHLPSTSPARDVGVIRTDVPTDRDGTTRPVGPTSDIGAYEFRSTTDTTPPLAPRGFRLLRIL